jgi:metallophosphoesterase superfamily enzyme
MMVRHIRLDRRQFYLFEGLGINSQERIADAMQAQIEKTGEESRPGFFYLLGDVIYPVGAPEGYNDLFYKPFKRYDAPIVAIPGNHDGYGRPDVPGSSLDGWRMNFLGALPASSPTVRATGQI